MVCIAIKSRLKVDPSMMGLNFSLSEWAIKALLYALTEFIIGIELLS